METDSPIIKLRTKEGKEFPITLEEGQISELIRDATEDRDEDAGEMEPIDITRVEDKCLEKVVEFMKHYHQEKMNDIPTPLGGSTFNEVMEQEWYQNFVSEENLAVDGISARDMLFALLTAANFMGIKPLLDLTCLKVTFQLTGKNAEEIRQLLKLPELTPEEEAKAREEHKWIFEDA